VPPTVYCLIVLSFARHEIYKHGMLEACFIANNKLISINFTYDVMSFMQQLRRASGILDFQIIPNTPTVATEDSSEPRLIVEYEPPHSIVFVNKSFCEISSFPNEKLIGLNLNKFFVMCGYGDELHQNHITRCMKVCKMISYLTLSLMTSYEIGRNIMRNIYIVTKFVFPKK
jgi:hypothetical protein